MNAQVDWSEFDSEIYEANNYRTLRDDDQQIIDKVRDFFAAADIAPNARGLDIGAGPNLYPALSMLPFCERIDLWEYSEPNLEWLRRQVPSFESNWDRFWEELARDPAYARVSEPRRRLASVAAVERGSIFDLPKRTWDVGTMFFVACSISTEIEEFEEAVHSFVQSLRADAPFAAAFMLESEGYDVGSGRFPSVWIDMDRVTSTLEDVAYDVHVDAISSRVPLRKGYHGMCLAVGRALA
jgi:hypothetical protein